MKLIGYCRVSTEEQGQEGHSLEEQQLRIKAYCDAHPDLELVGMVQEVGSAKSLNRAQLQNCLHKLDKGEADGIIIVALDRLTRNLQDLLHIVGVYFRPKKEQDHRNLVSISEHLDLETPTGRMLVYFIGIFAQWQRERISEHSKRISAHLKADGRRYNAQPLYGMMPDPEDPSRLIPCPGEQENLDRIRELRCIEGLSLTETVLVLKDEDRRNRAGTYWSKPSVSRLCRRHDYYPPSQETIDPIESPSHS